MSDKHDIANLEELYPYIAKKTVVEIGCGNGKRLLLFAKHADKVIGYEGDKDTYKTAIENIKHLNNVALINAYTAPSRMISADVYYVQQFNRWGNGPEYIEDFFREAKENDRKGLVAIPQEKGRIFLKEI